MSDDDERVKNFVLFKIWATDEDLEEMAPVLLVTIGIVAIIGALVLIFI